MLVLRVKATARPTKSPEVETVDIVGGWVTWRLCHRCKGRGKVWRGIGYIQCKLCNGYGVHGIIAG